MLVGRVGACLSLCPGWKVVSFRSHDDTSNLLGVRAALPPRCSADSYAMDRYNAWGSMLT